MRLQEGHGTIMYGGELMTIVAAESSDNGLTIHALFRNDDAPEGNPLSFSVRIDGGGSLDDAIEQSARNCRHRNIDGNSLGRGGAAEMDRVARQCLKVLATVALLAVGRSELLEPDVLSRDRAKMQSADGEARSRIAAAGGARRDGPSARRGFPATRGRLADRASDGS